MRPLLAAALLLIAQQPADLAWKPVVGQEKSYDLVMTSTSDGPQGAMEVIVKLRAKARVTEVAEGLVKTTSSVSDMSISFNGQAMDPSMANQGGEQVETAKLDGSMVLAAQDPGQFARVNRSIVAGNPRRPERLVAVGESYEYEVKADATLQIEEAKAKITLKGEETVKGLDCWKLDYVYSEMIPTNPVSAIGTLWIDKATGDFVKSVLDFENYRSVNIMPPSNAHVETVLVTAN